VQTYIESENKCNFPIVGFPQVEAMQQPSPQRIPMFVFTKVGSRLPQNLVSCFLQLLLVPQISEQFIRSLFSGPVETQIKEPPNNKPLQKHNLHGTGPHYQQAHSWYHQLTQQTEHQSDTCILASTSADHWNTKVQTHIRYKQTGTTITTRT